MQKNLLNYSLSPPRQRLVVWALFVIALVLRLLHFADSQNNPFFHIPIIDEQYYVSAARRIAEGQWWPESGYFYMDPLLAYLLGIQFKLMGDSIFTARLLMLVIDALNVLLIYFLGMKVWNERIGALAGGIYGIYSVAIFYSTLLLKTTLTVTFLLVIMGLSLHIIRRPSLKYMWVFVGAITALAAYLRANLGLLLLIIPLYILFAGKSGRKKKLLGCIWFFVGAAVIFMTDGYRQLQSNGEISLLAQNGGYVFYISNNRENSRGDYKVPSFIKQNHPDRLDYYFRKEAQGVLGVAISTRQASTYWGQQAITYLVETPRVIPGLVLAKLGILFGNEEIPNNYSKAVFSRYSRVLNIPFPNFALLLALGLPGLWLASKMDRRAVLLFAPVIVVVLTSVIFYSSSRLRFPIVPSLILGASYYVYVLIGQTWKKSVAGLMASTLIFFGSILVAEPVSDFNNQSFNLVFAHIKLGELEKAKKILAGVGKKSREAARYLQLKGAVALMEGRYIESIGLSNRAIEMEPNYAPALFNIGVANYHTGKMREAVKALLAGYKISMEWDYLYWVARSWKAQGEYQRAKKIFEEILKNGSKSAPYYAATEKELAVLLKK